MPATANASAALVRFARGLALGAGVLDVGAGLGLGFAPGLVLGWAGLAAPGAEALVYLRWVGVFAAAVGASYLLALAAGGTARLRAVLEFTLVFRLAVGTFAAAAVVRGWLAPLWAVVAVADFALAGLQGWLLAKGVFRHA